MTYADPASLEPSIGELRRHFDIATHLALEHLANVGAQPACGDTTSDLRVRRGEPLPEAPSDVEALLRTFFHELAPRALTTNGPGYLAYIPGGGVHTAALADLAADVTNRFTGARFAAPALVELEADALDWLKTMMGFPASAGGIFTTGGSSATFNAIVCARERKLGPDIRRGVLYTSTQAHHSVIKSARLAGIHPDRVRGIDVNRDFQMVAASLLRAIEHDRAEGLVPFMVVSSAGTTNTGAVDPLDRIQEIAERDGLWHHVDGVYGAFFHVVPEMQKWLPGLARVDSITLDPHKGLFLPYGTGALLVKDAHALRAVHGSEASYLPDALPEDLYDPSQVGPDLSRGFPGFRVWLTLKVFGMQKIRAAIAEKRALAVNAAERIAALPGVEMVAPPQLSLFAFHLRGATLDEENAKTRALLDRVLAKKRTFLSGCRIGERFLVRVCVLSFRTRAAHVDACVEDIAEAIALDARA